MKFFAIAIICFLFCMGLAGYFLDPQKRNLPASSKGEMSIARSFAWIAVLLFSLILSGAVAENSTKPAANTAKVYVPSVNMVDEVEISGKLIRKELTTADELFGVATSSDEVGEAKTSPDFLLPNSLEVRHEYRIDGNNYTFWLTRKVSNGPYYVTGIAVEGGK